MVADAPCASALRIRCSKADSAFEPWSDAENVDVGGATLSRTVALECTVPFGTRALAWHKPCRHLNGFLCPGIELGYQLTRFQEETCNCGPAGVDHDKVTRRFSVRCLDMRTRGFTSKSLAHRAMLPRPAPQVLCHRNSSEA